MSSALLIRVRPAGPWRYGPGDGARDRVDSLYRSDRLFSAVSQAMLRLGHLDAWPEAPARAPHPAVDYSSLFPFQADTLFAPPPQTLWPPAVAALRTPSPVFLTKVRWRTAQFVPVSVIESLMTGSQINADQWIADAESGCLLRRDRPQSSPFRTVVRTRVPVDRITNRSAEGHTTACIEFEAGAGLWAVALFADAAAQSAWSELVQAAFRLLGDTGFGGSRSSGWGQAPSPECQVGDWPGLLFPKLARGSRNGTADELSPLHWLLSVYSPAGDDAVDWAEGKYALTIRGGRVESQAGWGAEKKLVRMVTEGSVVSAGTSLKGQAVDVAPDGFAHPVYRAGFALALQLPVVHMVETPEPAPAEEVAETADIPPEVEPAEPMSHAEVEGVVSSEASERREEAEEEPVVRFEAPEILEQKAIEYAEAAEPISRSELAEDRVDEEASELAGADAAPEVESAIETPIEDAAATEEAVKPVSKDATPETKTGESEADGHEL